MAPRTEEQYIEIRNSKKALIQETALELFATKGYHSSSISMIAKMAGISKGLIYNYYSSKEELLNEIINHGLDQIKSMMTPNNNGQMNSFELEPMIHESFKMVEAHPKFWSLYFSLLPQQDVFKIVKENFIETYKLLTGMMTDYFRIKGMKDPEAEAIILGSLLDGVFINYIFDMENYPLEAVKKKLIEIYCK